MSSIRRRSKQRNTTLSECLTWMLLPIAAVALGGCDIAKSRGWASIQGSVSYEGQPVGDGKITFLPQAPNGRAVSSEIHKGTYSIPSKLKLAGGEYYVQIAGYRPTGKKGTPSPYGSNTDLEIHEQYIPAVYNNRTELTASIDTGETKTLNFDLKAKP